MANQNLNMPTVCSFYISTKRQLNLYTAKSLPFKVIFSHQNGSLFLRPKNILKHYSVLYLKPGLRFKLQTLDKKSNANISFFAVLLAAGC